MGVRASQHDLVLLIGKNNQATNSRALLAPWLLPLDDEQIKSRYDQAILPWMEARHRSIESMHSDFLGLFLHHKTY
jgi:hypothetical protein